MDSVNVFKKHTLGSNKLYHCLIGKRQNVSTSLNDVVDNTLKESAKEKKYDAINISLGYSIDFKKLSKALGMEITRENIKSLAKEIKKCLANPKENISVKGQPLPLLSQIIDKMDSISSRGTKFYIGAGNDGKNSVNLLNLVDNAINVGALEKNNKKADFSCDNSLVNRWEISDLDIERVEGGFDITGHGKADVHYDETTFFQKEKFKGFYHMPLQGTSFSTPKALVRDFSNRIY